MTVHLKLQQKNLDFLWLENKRNKFNKNHIVQVGGKTGSMYILSYEVRWYVHIYIVDCRGASQQTYANTS